MSEVTDENDDGDEAPPKGNDALERAHTAKPADLAGLRGELEWATTQSGDAALWLALGVIYLRLGDRASAETTLRHAEQRAGEKQLATALEICAALDATRGGPFTFEGEGILRTGPKRRIYVELPGATFRWAALRVGELLRAGVTPKAGEPITCRARLGRRSWEIVGLKPTGTVPRGVLGKDGTYVRCGELRFLPLVDPCPPDQLRWESEPWKAAVNALPIRVTNDRKTHVAWKELGVANWAELAATSTDATVETAPVIDDGTGKLSAKGKHLVIGNRPRELIDVDVCEPGARRGRYFSWRQIADAVPYVVAEGEAGAAGKVGVDWPTLSTKHALELHVASWAALAAVLDARPPPPKREKAAAEPPAPAEPEAGEPTTATEEPGKITEATEATEATEP